MTDKIDYLPLSALRESPFNPRKAFAEGPLAELAESIKAQGVMQPIVARPLELDQPDLMVRYEIVVGHRRYRAAQLAGLERVPTIVREMDDLEAAIAQTHENSQRQDVTVIEEADSFAHLHKAHKLSADAIADRVKKSRSYVYGRIKIAKSAPEVRKACVDEALPPEVALEVARLPHHDLQRKGLKDLRCWTHAYVDGKDVKTFDGWQSVRDAKRTLKGMFDTDLEKAPFDLADSLLAARAGACTTCPRRAGNDPDLQDVLAPSICTDKGCYQVKVTAHQIQRIAQLRKDGCRVLEGDDAKALQHYSWVAPHGYVNLGDVAYKVESADGDDVEKPVTFADLLATLGKKAPKPLGVVHPDKADRLQLLITDAEADAALEAVGHQPRFCRDDEDLDDDDASTPSSAAHARTGAAVDDRPPEIRACANHATWRPIKLEIMRRAVAAERTADDLRIILRSMIDVADDVPADVAVVMGWTADLAPLENYGDDTDWLKAKLHDMPANELARLALALALDSAPFIDGAEDYYASRLALAQRYGVDVLASPAGQDQPVDAGSAGGSEAQLDAFDEAGV